MTTDIKDLYLTTPMNQYKYMRIPVRAIPACVIEQYEREPLVHSGHVLVEIREGMYDLPQTGKLAIDRLVKYLSLLVETREGMYGLHQTGKLASIDSSSISP
jgi:hypothetical protein